MALTAGLRGTLLDSRGASVGFLVPCARSHLRCGASATGSVLQSRLATPIHIQRHPGFVPRRVVRRGPHRRSSGNPIAVQAAAQSSTTLADAELIPVEGGSFPGGAGVYAIFDNAGFCHYVGLSRKVSASIATHAQDVPELTHAAKVILVENPTKDNLTNQWKECVNEIAQIQEAVPPGNLAGNNQWKQKRVTARPEIKLTPGKGIEDLTCKVEDLIDAVVKDRKVVAFVKGTRFQPQCGFSHRVLTMLNEVGADYDVVNVLDEVYNPGLRDAIKSYSQWPTIPQVYINGEFIGGADIVAELHETGGLKDLVSK